jgi:hypothetical protein
VTLSYTHITKGFKYSMKDARLNVSFSMVPTDQWKRWHVIEHAVWENTWTRGVELGVKEGKTLFHLLQFCPKLHMIGIDVWEPFEGMPEEVWPHKKYYDVVMMKADMYPRRCRTIKGLTQDVHNKIQDNSVDFVFIDADHSVKEVERDINYYTPKVRKGGAMFGHDIHFESVREAVWNVYGPDYTRHPNNVWMHYVN